MNKYYFSWGCCCCCSSSSSSLLIYIGNTTISLFPPTLSLTFEQLIECMNLTSPVVVVVVAVVVLLLPRLRIDSTSRQFVFSHSFSLSLFLTNKQMNKQTNKRMYQWINLTSLVVISYFSCCCLWLLLLLPLWFFFFFFVFVYVVLVGSSFPPTPTLSLSLLLLSLLKDWMNITSPGDDVGVVVVRSLLCSLYVLVLVGKHPLSHTLPHSLFRTNEWILFLPWMLLLSLWLLLFWSSFR